MRRAFEWARRDTHDDPQAVPFVAGMSTSHGLHRLTFSRVAGYDPGRGGGLAAGV